MTSSVSALVGQTVRAEMARAGVTQAELAHQLGIDQTTISARLRGKTRFTIDDLAAIARALGVPLETLTERAVVTSSAVGVGFESPHSPALTAAHRLDQGQG